MKRLVLIADIIGSKKIKKREEIQKQLKKQFNLLNQSDKNILSPFTITLGDEFQAVFSKADHLFNHIWKIMLAVYPEKIRFSIGIGEITTAINKKQAIGMDGPAFYNARQGLIELKQTNYFFNISGIDDIGLIRQSLYLISHLSYNWKETRLKTLVMMAEDYPVNDIAKKLKISDKAVYKNIDAGALSIIIKLNKEISDKLNLHLKK